MRKTKQELRQDAIDIRRNKVLDCLSQGYTNHREIAQKLHISHDKVDRDIEFLREHAKEHIQKYVTEDIPLEYAAALVSIKSVIRNMSDIIDRAKKNKDGTAKDDPDDKRIMGADSVKMQAENLLMELIAGAVLVQENIDLSNKYRGLMAQKDKLLKDDSSISA